MESRSEVVIADITRSREYEPYLYRCLAPMSFRRHGKRQRYLEEAMPKGFHKAILLFRDDIVGQIEYAPAVASGLPILGDDIIVMNCIWVLRRAKGHAFGRLLLNHMTKAEAGAVGFSTIALEDHPSRWLKRWQMEWLGFKPIDSVKMRHKKMFAPRRRGQRGLKALI
jgi:hypothetical protein